MSVDLPQMPTGAELEALFAKAAPAVFDAFRRINEAARAFSRVPLPTATLAAITYEGQPRKAKRWRR
jgi:hypothetical protein